MLRKIVLPFGVCVRIVGLIAETARTSLACLVPCVTVEAEEQTSLMDIFSEGGHSRGKFGSVLNDFVGGFISVDLPTVVQIDIFVAFGGQASAG